MIIWIASYPKSGNTLLRSLIYSLFFSNDGFLDLSKLSVIPNYNQIRFFEGLISKDERFDIKKISENWNASQSRINSSNKLKLLKTHNSNCKINGNPFTTKKNTAGVILVVRDPRDVVLSASNHFSLSNKKVCEILLDRNAKLLPRENLEHEIVTILGSWVDNFKYWYNYRNCLLIKYEDMINNKYKVILELIKYFKMFVKTNISEEKINNTIKSTSFSNMQKQEVKGFFKESVTVDKKKIQFFNKGKSKNWVGNLDKKIQNKLEKSFYNEMKFLGYL
jgi:hypothetical protein